MIYDSVYILHKVTRTRAIMSTTPLIIDAQDVVSALHERQGTIFYADYQSPTLYQGATKELALQAAESSAQAFLTWSKTTPIERRTLLFKLAEVRVSRK